MLKELKYVFGFLLTFFLPVAAIAIAYALTDSLVVRSVVFLAAIAFAVFVHTKRARTPE